MKADTVKMVAVYANVTFIIVAGFFVLYQLATRSDLDPAQAQALGAASIFSGFVGMAIQFLTGSEIAKRAEVAANTAFTTGAGTALTVPGSTTTTTSEGPPATSTTTTVGPSVPPGDLP